VLDGVYRCGADGVPTLVEVGVPTDDELHALLQAIITRLMKVLERRGVLIEEMGQTRLAEPEADGEARAHCDHCRPRPSSTALPLIRAGHKVLALRGAMPR
jgi:hypothetical protein